MANPKSKPRKPLEPGEHPKPTPPAQTEPADLPSQLIDKVDLPACGGWARFRDPDTITEAGRRQFKLAVAKAKMGDPAGVVESDDMAIAMFTEQWSLELPIPQADPAGLQTLDPVDYDALLSAAMLMLPLVFGVDFQVTVDQSSPFGR